jgi:transposase-like protein
MRIIPLSIIQSARNQQQHYPVVGSFDCDGWTWTAIDADTKLIPSWFVGGRDSDAAMIFMDDLASRLANRVQLTSDGHRAYLEAVEAHSVPMLITRNS